MEIDYVDKLSILKSNRPVAEIIIAKDKLRFSIESNRNIFSINQIKKIDKGLNNDFKKLFSFSCPEVSKFNFNQDSIALWVRSNSYFVISKNIQFDEILSNFQDKASLTDQTGGWIQFTLDGSACLSLFEKLLTINLDDFDQGKVTRTNIVNINCFILCKSKFDKYIILCPISYYETMKSRLVNLINLLVEDKS
jgi:sarcosine oxidase gamma subunit